MKKTIFLLNALLCIIYCSAQVPDPVVMVLTQPTCTEPTGTIQVTYPVANQPMNLFISEVTDSNNGGLSYVELYNGTGASINLFNYSIKVAHNGSNSYDFTLGLNNIALASGTTYVVALGAGIGNACNVVGGDGSLSDQNTTDPTSSVNFATNGNDHIGLFNGTTLIDTWGVYGSVSWAPAFIGTEGSNFRRKNNISPLPNPTYNNNDWDIFDYAGNLCANNDYSNVGIYTLNTTVNYQYSVDSESYQSSTFFSGLAPGTHTINVQDIATGFISSTTVTINPNPLPIISQASDYDLCETTPPIGIETFDLNSQIPLILNGQTGVQVSFYPSIADATANTNVISNPSAYSNTQINIQTIGFRLTNINTGCYITSTMDLVVLPKPQPTQPTQPYFVCDNNQDGISSFDLNTLTTGFLQGAPEVYTISYYLNSSDAETTTNPIDLSVPYINYSSPFQQFLWVRAENPITHCFTTIQIVLEVAPAPIMPTNLSAIVLCDTDNNPNDGCTTFNLFNQTPIILAAQSSPASNFTVTYYTSQTDASASDVNGNLNPISDIFNYHSCGNTSIWVRLENNITGCYSIATFQLIVNPLTSGQCNYVTDADGNLYNTVLIGNQEWMAENLKTTKYCNGETLPMNNNNSTGTWGNLTVGAWNFVNSNSSIYPNEKFYNWYAASDSRNICPCDWHVPSDSEWTILENYLISNGFNYDGTTSGNKIAKAMASQNSFWNSSLNIGAVGNNLSLNNSSGFNALPFGLITESGINYGYNAGNYAFWWTSNEWNTDNTYALWRGLSSQNNNLWSGAPDIGMKTAGFSIRCLKNTPLGIENQSKITFNIYPNPSKGVFTLQMFKFFDENKIEIYTAFGQKIYDCVISSNYTIIDISSQPIGIYFYKIYDGNNINSGKLILE